MLRSLFAIIVANIVGVAVAKLIENMGMTAFPPPSDIDVASRESILYVWSFMPAGYKLMLAAGWLIGALAASSVALLLGRRWAPLGWLGAACIGFHATMTLFYFPAELWLWFASIFSVAAGGLAGHVLWHPTMAFPQKKAAGLFGG